MAPSSQRLEPPQFPGRFTTKAAKYGKKHLEQLLLIKKWTASGLSLERIKELLQGEEAPVPARTKRPGAIEVCSHLYVADGIELVLEPTRSGLTPEQVRGFAKGVMELFASITTDAPDEPTSTD